MHHRLAYDEQIARAEVVRVHRDDAQPSSHDLDAGVPVRTMRVHAGTSGSAVSVMRRSPSLTSVIALRSPLSQVGSAWSCASSADRSKNNNAPANCCAGRSSLPVMVPGWVVAHPVDWPLRSPRAVRRRGRWRRGPSTGSGACDVQIARRDRARTHREETAADKSLHPQGRSVLIRMASWS
jgi:hypothetical protein